MTEGSNLLAKSRVFKSSHPANLEFGQIPMADILPGAKIIGAEVEVPDMKWIWEVFEAVISFGP